MNEDVIVITTDRTYPWSCVTRYSTAEEIHSKLYRNEGRDGSPRLLTFDCHWRDMESGVKTKTSLL
jgi:hypothetical protein